MAGHPEELVDIVDRDDTVVGTISKGEAHERGLLHRIVMVFVFDSSGNLLLHRRATTKRLDASASGHVGAGESYATAAGRELEEEIGLHTPLSHVGTILAKEGERIGPYLLTHHIGIFVGTHVTEEPIRILPEEVIEVLAFPLSEIKHMYEEEPELFSPTFIRTFPELLASLPS